MKKLTVAIDLDGVICNYHYSFSKIANDLFGTPIIHDIQKVKNWEWWVWYPLTKSQYALVWEEAKNTKNWWINLNPLVNESVFKILESLDADCNLFFVTHRVPTRGMSLTGQIRCWFSHFCDIKNYSIIPVVEPKGRVLKAIGTDFFIDDKPENVMDASVEVPESKNYLLVRTYNNYSLEFIKTSNVYNKIKIAYSVESFLNDIKRGVENG